jgi:ribosomal protein S18 acetylase RimI-like enzyme
MPITIRRATPDDAEAISAVWEAVCAERIYTAVNRPFTPQQERDFIASLSDREGTFVAEADGHVVGFQSLDLWAKYTDSFDHVGVMGSIISSQWRRKGIGQRLAKHTLAFARANGYEKIVIYVRAGNTGAQAFYRNLGFVQKGVLARQVKIDDRYEDEVFMELFL